MNLQLSSVVGVPMIVGETFWLFYKSENLFVSAGGIIWQHLVFLNEL